MKDILTWTKFLASPDLEQLLTKTKKELQQAPSVHSGKYVSLSRNTCVLQSILDSFFFSIVKVLLKIQKLIECLAGISPYSPERKAIGLVQFRLSV
jgi:hypothetical protein